MLGVLLFFAFPCIAFAQSGTMRGKVVESGSQGPLPGANVLLQGTNFGAAADINGNFVIRNIPAGEYTIAISYIGYERTTATVTVQANTVLEQDFVLSPTVLMGEVVTITAQGEGQVTAIQQQLASNRIANIVSEAKIQELPDWNTAQALSRLPGISTLKSSGEDNKVVVRGLAPQYNVVELEGTKLPSTGSTQIGATSQLEGVGSGNVSSDQSVDLSLMSPYMIQSIQLYKAVTPDMNANVIGGLVNIDLREAPEGFRGDVLWQSGYTDKSGKYGNYRTVLSASNRFFNSRLGAYILLNAEAYDRNADNMTAGYRVPEYYPNENRLGDVAVDNVQLSRYIENRQRYGANLILDYPLGNGTIKSINMFSRLRSDFNDNRVIFGYLTGNLNFRYREGVNNTDIAMNSLQFDYDFGRVQVDATLANSFTINDLPQTPRFNFTFTGGIVGQTPVNTVPEDLTQQIRFDELGGADNIYLTQIDYLSSKFKEDSRSANVNFTIPFALSTSFTGYFKTGGIYRYESRTMDQHTPYATMRGGSPIQDRMLDALAAEFGVQMDGDRFPGSAFTSNNSDLYKPFLDDKFGRFFWAVDPTIPIGFARYLSEHRDDFPGASSGPQGGGGWFDGLFQQIANDYEHNLNYYATYLMAEVNFLDFMVVGGVRYERDESEFTAYNMVDAREPRSQTFTEITTRPKYEFWLPSVQVRYRPFDWGDVRYAFSQTLARPAYHMTSPKITLSYNLRDVWAGNPDLRPAQSYNQDLIFTFYSNKLGLFSVGGFYKTISDFSYYTRYIVYEAEFMPPGHETLESLAERINPSPIEGAALNTYINTPYDATVKGIEFDLQTRLWYLPGLLQGIVVGGNYTLISSEARYPFKDTESIRNPNFPGPGQPPFIPSLIDSSRVGRLINQPNNILNAYIGFDHRGFSTRVSYTFIENAVSGVSDFEERDGFTRDYHQVDFRVRQEMPLRGLEVFLDINNLTSATNISAQKTIGGFTNQQLYGLVANIGFRYRL
jgi:TonB-dependent receptor